MVASMRQRKTIMAELADGFIALFGGLGALDELFEILTWAQLGLHHKPCGVLNVKHYYAPLEHLLDHCGGSRFRAAAAPWDIGSGGRSEAAADALRGASAAALS